MKKEVNPNIINVIKENFDHYEIVVHPSYIVLKNEEKFIIATIYLTNYVFF